MGNCLKVKKPIIGNIIAEFIPPPSSSTKLTNNEVFEIIQKNTKCNQIIMWDGAYSSIEMEDVKRFLISNINQNYVSELYDCDNFSLSLCARIHEWNSKGKKSGNGLAFGILTGDLRLKESDPIRPHAVCFFIDKNKNLFLTDGMYNSVLEFEPWMTCWTVIV